MVAAALDLLSDALDLKICVFFVKNHLHEAYCRVGKQAQGWLCTNSSVVGREYIRSVGEYEAAALPSTSEARKLFGVG